MNDKVREGSNHALFENATLAFEAAQSVKWLDTSWMTEVRFLAVLKILLTIAFRLATIKWCTRGYSPRSQWLQHEADHSPSHNAKVRNACFTSTLHHVFKMWCQAHGKYYSYLNPEFLGETEENCTNFQPRELAPWPGFLNRSQKITPWGNLSELCSSGLDEAPPYITKSSTCISCIIIKHLQVRNNAVGRWRRVETYLCSDNPEKWKLSWLIMMTFRPPQTFYKYWHNLI